MTSLSVGQRVNFLLPFGAVSKVREGVVTKVVVNDDDQLWCMVQATQAELWERPQDLDFWVEENAVL